MKVMRRILVSALFFLLCVCGSALAGKKADDDEALTGLKTAAVIFDVRVPDAEKLLFNLELFTETWDGLVAQGVQPKMVISFRGPGVKLLTAPVIDKDALQLIRELKAKGVRFEACAVAMRVFKVDPAQLVPEVKLVANVLNSQIGYQNKGYATVSIN